MQLKFPLSDPFAGKSDALIRLGGRSDLYFKYLQCFRSHYSDSTQVLIDFLDKGDYQGAGIFVHSVKGLAATLGMEDLRQVAAFIEDAISRGNYCDLPHLINDFENSLYYVLQSSLDHSSSSEGTGFSGLK